MNSAAALLLKKFERKHRLLESEIGKTQKAALQELLKEGRVVHARAYYLAGLEPTIDTARDKIVQKLLSRPRLFRESALRPRFRETWPSFRAALSELIGSKVVIKLALLGGDSAEYFIHRDHLLRSLGLVETSASEPADNNHLELNAKGNLGEQIHQTYEKVAREKGRRSIFISDLVRASGLDWKEVREWIEQEIVEKGHGQLDEGDWNAATEEQRAAAVELWGRKRLYIALP